MSLLRLLANLVGGIIVILVVIQVYNFPKQYDCLRIECNHTNLNDCASLKDLGIEHTGFLTDNHYYNCDGMKITESCLEYQEVKQDFSPTIEDILLFKCAKLKEKTK